MAGNTIYVQGSYGALARHVGIVVNENNKDPKNNYKTFADYMGHYKGRTPPLRLRGEP